TCGSANSGDTLILWGTGLGPVDGDDASGSGLGQNEPDIPVTVWVGGVQATIAYQGRSGCCIGEDQLGLTVPDDAPTGCAVPPVVQIGNFVSNSTVVPIANAGRSCTPIDAVAASTNFQQLGALGSFSLGTANLSRLLNSDRTDYVERADFIFVRASV